VLTLLRHNKNKNMSDKKAKLPTISKQTLTFAMIMVVVGTASGVPIAKAATLQQQIDALSAENAQKQKQNQVLKVEAADLQETINGLQVQINAMQAQIDSNTAKSQDLEKQIVEAQAELEKQRKLLGDSIKAMYLEGDISTIEMLATSKDLSDYFDKQQYRDVVKTKIKTTLEKVTALKAQLKEQQEELARLIEEQKTLQSQLQAQRSEQNRLLNLNESQRSALNSEIKANFSRISDLKRQQILENSKFFANGVPAGSSRGGGYPEIWASRPLDAMLDSWGMYSRECVSYGAWRVYSSGRNMPGWGWQGRGNANMWDDNARNMGIPVDRNPQAGDIAVSNAGTYGHVMYVEAVADDGAIYVSDYNLAWDGLYREYWISASSVDARNLSFIHFP